MQTSSLKIVPADGTIVGVDAPHTKAELRESAIARRKTVSQADRIQAGHALANAVKPLLHDLVPGSTVAAYVSMGSEIPTQPLLKTLLDAGYRVLVPRLGTGMEVGWGSLRALGNLHDVNAGPSDRRFRFRRPQEPNSTTLGTTALESAMLILMPALMVDVNGVRLGRGGGWYDRAMAWRSPSASTVAVCWPWEVSASSLPRESHDVPVDAALTPESLIPLGARW